jgi:hypothetical protein
VRFNYDSSGGKFPSSFKVVKLNLPSIYSSGTGIKQIFPFQREEILKQKGFQVKSKLNRENNIKS